MTLHDHNDAPQPDPPPVPPEHSKVPDQKVVVVANRHAAAERKNKARRNLLIIIAAVVIAAAAFWYFEVYAPAPLQKVASFESEVTSAVQQNFSSFPSGGVTSTKPVKLTTKQESLDAPGVIAATNMAREGNGDLPPLTESATLDDVAMLRLDDMFANQYFAHVDPSSGESALTVASSVGYRYIALGENLAEGWFAGDQGVVTAWMNSPEHRANILNTHYTEIGVAVREGEMNGQQAWIAVQVFGKPTSACPPAPDPTLNEAITDAETALNDMSTELADDQIAINAMQPQSGDAYNQKVAQYNALVVQYNSLSTQTKTEVDQYNGQVAAYNACL